VDEPTASGASMSNTDETSAEAKAAKRRLKNRRRKEKWRQNKKVKMKDVKIKRIWETRFDRTLRASSRRHLQSQVDATYWTPPWIADPGYRYNPDELHPVKSLLGLPAELRQAILRYTLNEDTVLQEMTRQDIGLRIGKLCCVHPLIRLDIVYIGHIWKSDKKRFERSSHTLPWGSSVQKAFIVTALPVRQRAAAAPLTSLRQSRPATPEAIPRSAVLVLQDQAPQLLKGLSHVRGRSNRLAADGQKPAVAERTG